MVLNREQLIKSKTKPQKPQELELPSGDSVLLRVPTGKDYREWKRYLRDESGVIIQARADRSDELLVATLLVNQDSTPMFTRDEVMSGEMDNVLQIDMEAMKDRAYELYGQREGIKLVLDEDREKNSSATVLSE